MTWRYTIHLEMASVISLWAPPEGLARQLSRGFKCQTFVQERAFRREQSWHQEAGRGYWLGAEPPILTPLPLELMTGNSLPQGKRPMDFRAEKDS